MSNRAKKPHYYEAQDYAGLTTQNAKFYYGYERVDSGEWCFVAEIANHPEIVIPFSNLGVEENHRWDCAHCLCVGMGWVITKYGFRIPETEET